MNEKEFEKKDRSVLDINIYEEGLVEFEDLVKEFEGLVGNISLEEIDHMIEQAYEGIFGKRRL